MEIIKKKREAVQKVKQELPLIDTIKKIKIILYKMKSQKMRVQPRGNTLLRKL